MRTLVILGGGTAGTMTANKLRGRLSADEWRIVVVDKNDDHDYQPGYLFVPFGINKVKQIRKSRQEFIGEGIDLEFGEIERVDADTKIVHLSGERELAYDYLVIATGTTPRPDQTPGMLGPQWRSSAAQRLTDLGVVYEDA